MQTKKSVLDQIAVACGPGNRTALAIGTILGGFVPVATYVVAHHETTASPFKWILVAGGLVYSASTMFQWAREAFGNPFKAAGFVVILEGTAVVSSTELLGFFALACLTAVNAAATACSLASERSKPKRARTKPTTTQASSRLRTSPNPVLTGRTRTQTA